MSIERENRLIIFICDGKSCHEILETDTGDFQTALIELDDNNWKARKINDEWTHTCPDCLETEYELAL